MQRLCFETVADKNRAGTNRHEDQEWYESLSRFVEHEYTSRLVGKDFSTQVGFQTIKIFSYHKSYDVRWED